MSATTINPVTIRPVTSRPVTRTRTHAGTRTHIRTHARTRTHTTPSERRSRRSATPRRITDAGTATGSTHRGSAVAYRRRRAVVGIVLAVLVAAGAVLAHDVLAGSGGVPASAAASQPARTRSTVTARPGDTLWSIAESHHGDVPLSRYVDVLVDLNGGAGIQAGQAVILP